MDSTSSHKLDLVDKTVKDLVDLFAYAHLLSKPTERKFVLNTTGNQEMLDSIPMMRNLICPPGDDEIHHKPDMARICKKHAKKYLEKSNELIPGKLVTYGEVNNFLSQLLCSSYASLPILKVDYNGVVVGCFWDLVHSTLPYEFNTDAAMSKIRTNIFDKLKKKFLVGKLDITAFGNFDNFKGIDFRRLNMKFVNSPNIQNGKKTTSDKRLIGAAVDWTYEYLKLHKEPGYILLITDDKDSIKFVVDEATDLGFRVLVACGGGVSLTSGSDVSSKIHHFGDWPDLAGPSKLK